MPHPPIDTMEGLVAHVRADMAARPDIFDESAITVRLARPFAAELVAGFDLMTRLMAAEDRQAALDATVPYDLPEDVEVVEP